MADTGTGPSASLPEVAFHFNAPDRLAHAFRLLRKALTRGVRTHVLADRPLALRLDAGLWVQVAGDFLPHCLDDAPPQVLRRSPVVLGPSVMDVQPQAQVLVNLSDALPDSSRLARYRKIIEVVSTLPGEREVARERWRWYRQSGMVPQQHDLGATPTSAHH